MPIVTFTTDFGAHDGYVGALKGVVLSLAPQATLVDVAHGVPARDVAGGAVALAQAAPLFPAGTIHVVVVDPAWDVDAIEKTCVIHGKRLCGILLTHSHKDHTNGVGELLARRDLPVYASRAEVEFSDDEGRTYATLALRADQLMVLHYRPVEAA